MDPRSDGCAWQISPAQVRRAGEREKRAGLWDSKQEVPIVTDARDAVQRVWRAVVRWV